MYLYLSNLFNDQTARPWPRGMENTTNNIHGDTNNKKRSGTPLYSWNPNDLCFDWKGHCFGGFNHQNRGQTGSRLMDVSNTWHSWVDGWNELRQVGYISYLEGTRIKMAFKLKRGKQHQSHPMILLRRYFSKDSMSPSPLRSSFFKRFSPKWKSTSFTSFWDSMSSGFLVSMINFRDYTPRKVYIDIQNSHIFLSRYSK